MNHLRRQKAIKIVQESGLTDKAEIKDLLLSSDFDNDEANETLEYMDDPRIEDTDVNEYDPKNPNASLKLDFDYTKLFGKEFDRYIGLLEELSPAGGFASPKMYDFELWRMKPVIEERYPGLPNTPKDFKGVEFKEDEPKLIAKTRITISSARDYNQQITNEHSIKGYGKYYLLKQPKGITGKGR